MYRYNNINNNIIIIVRTVPIGGGGGGGGGSVPSTSEVPTTYLLSLAAAVRRANTVARIVSDCPVSSEKRVDNIITVVRLAPPLSNNYHPKPAQVQLQPSPAG